MPQQELTELERKRMVRKMRGIMKIVFVWTVVFALVSTIWWQFYSTQYYADVMISLFILIWFFTGALAVLMVADEAV